MGGYYDYLRMCMGWHSRRAPGFGSLAVAVAGPEQGGLTIGSTSSTGLSVGTGASDGGLSVDRARPIVTRPE
jgi:hypothetical protein